jgi:signal transduction histidine kinase
VLAAHDIPLAYHLQQVERDRLITSLQRDAFVIGGRSEHALEDRTAADDPALQQLLDDYRASTGGRVVITDRTGIASAISDEEISAGKNYATRPEIADALAGNPVTGERPSETLGFRLLYVAVPVRSGEEVIGTVRITYPAAEVGRRVRARVRGLAIVALISLVTAGGAALVLAGAWTRPIRRLRGATERLAGGDLTVTAPVGEGPPEIRSLAEAFNTMSRRIQGLVEGQRAFAGDASHQLRTPLTALRLRLDQAADIIDTDPAAARMRIEAAGAETERLQHLVDGLLALARADGNTDALITVDAAAVARERVAVWQPLAEEQGVQLSVTTPARADVLAVSGSVEQIIDNYLDNALAATPRHGAIDVAVECSPGGGDSTDVATDVSLHVRDTGPGMTDEQLAKAFDRFWRASGSATNGSGLGLAIVDQLARASGGEASVTTRPDGGIDAAVVLRSGMTEKSSTR